MAKSQKEKEELKEPIGGNVELPISNNENKASENEGDSWSDEVAENVISGAEFWDFDTDPIFAGEFTGKPAIREKDGKNAETNPNERAGSIMGFNFVDKNGEMFIIGNSHQIAKAIEDCGKKGYKHPRLRIEFLGQSPNASGQKVNRYKIDLLKGSK